MQLINRKEIFILSRFLACQPKESTQNKKPLTSVYGFMGLDITSNSYFSGYDFNVPYVVVFGVAGILILSTVAQSIFTAHGNPRKAEMVESFTRLIIPIAFYVFLAFGIAKVFL